MTSDAASDQGWVDPIVLRREDIERTEELARLRAELEDPDTSVPTLEEIRVMRRNARKTP